MVRLVQTPVGGGVGVARTIFSLLEQISVLNRAVCPQFKTISIALSHFFSFYLSNHFYCNKSIKNTWYQKRTTMTTISMDFYLTWAKIQSFLPTMNVKQDQEISLSFVQFLILQQHKIKRSNRLLKNYGKIQNTKFKVRLVQTLLSVLVVCTRPVYGWLG